MSNVVDEAKTEAHDLHTQLVAHISALSKHHVTLNYAVIGVLVLVLALCGLGGYFGLKSYEAQMARAEVKEAQFNADRKDLTAQLTASKTVQDTASKAQQVIVKVVHDRDTKADAAIAAATAPNKTAQEALSDLSAAYHGTIVADPNAITADGRLVFPVFTVQGFTATRIDRDRLSDDLKSSADNLAQEQKKTEQLAKDVAAANKAVADAEPAIKAYKKVAERSKWRKAAAGALKVGIFVAGVYAGKRL